MKVPIRYISIQECEKICLDHTGCEKCPLKLARNRCAYYLIKRDAKKTLTEEELDKEIEV